ncbi:uncharacterized protein LOC142333004 isoform X2 [Lycorma delicatula]|uniref:uncharacterized protein LOC142333004 isoform X2 n=1 Tax=Lycorma delicatula TaxID=130591 RepID=UPI003F50FD41
MRPAIQSPAAASELSVPCRLQVATSVTRYRSCTVDPGPSRVVHCPDLNACLVNEGRPPNTQVDCNAVHFGYAIPVKVVPTSSQLAELVLDADSDLRPDALSYLIQRHPQLREMATTAAEPEEDIAAIAKQISDHAEAIYQTWKSRGLAPTEILNCHSSGADRFKPALTPTTNRQQTPQPPSSQSPVVELLSSEQTNSLERLVNNFVVEDKARQASSNKSLPSSIQFALQKFERKAANSTSVPVRSNKTSTSSTPPSNKYLTDTIDSSSNKYLSESSSTKPSSANRYLTETIEATFPEDIDATPSKINNTWPLKSKLNDNNSIVGSKKNSPTSVVDSLKPKYNTLQSPSSKNHNSNMSATQYLDEVAKEEERLINALKTGIIIAEDPSSSSKRKKTVLNNNTNNNTSVGTSSGGISRESVSVVGSAGKTSPSVITSVNINKEKSVDVIDKTNSGPINRRINSTNINNNSNNNNSNNNNNNRNNRHTENVPHPAISRSSTPTTINPVRPFLTRGSVAERVLIFEKCPTEILEKRVKSAAPLWKTNSEIQSRAQNYSRESITSQKSQTSPPPHTTLQRHTKANRNLLIPRFHYPLGKPSNQQQLEANIDSIKQAFINLPGHQATKEKFGAITKAAGCPLYWKAPLFIACGGEKLGYVELNSFIEYWRNVCSTCHDPASRFMRILTRGQNRNYLLPEDFMPLIQDVVDTHPGLTFLKEAAEFHSRYVHTVISRIFYCVNQSWSGQISLPELRRSDFLRVVELLEAEDDINQVTQYFSYEHFYVIYCKFWELDRDHDLFIDKQDLARHSDHALSTRLIDRIFSGTVTRGNKHQQSQLNGQANAKMSYTEFVWFLLAEEDKMHPRAIEYWFRCMDLDGDGYLSMYELEYFYDEQLQRMEAIGIECLPFEDCLCQMLDMIRPIVPGKISLGDLKRCKMTPIFFDTFFNLEKYLDHEQRDPFASQRDHDTEMSDWDRYAAEEYELLVAEEGGNDNQNEIPYDDDDDDENGDGDTENDEDADDDNDDDDDNDILSPNLDRILSSQTYLNNNNNNNNNNNITNTKPRPVGHRSEWLQPSVTVSDFDNEYDTSSDYAADSDDCSL